MHHPTDRITHTTAFVTPVVEHRLEQEIAQWVHPMKDRSDDPQHHELRPAPYCFRDGSFIIQRTIMSRNARAQSPYKLLQTCARHASHISVFLFII